MRRVCNLIKRGGRKVMDKVEATKEVVNGLLNDSDKRKVVGVILIGVGLSVGVCIAGIGTGLLVSGYVG